MWHGCRVIAADPWLTCISCIWWRSLDGSFPQSRRTLGSSGKALYQTGASPGGPQACHWGGWLLLLLLLLLLSSVNIPSSEGWGWGGPIEPSEMGMRVVMVRGVQQPKPLIICWLLHWVDQGTCITSMPPWNLKTNTQIRMHTIIHI